MNRAASLLAATLFGLAGLGCAALAGLELAPLRGWGQGRVSWMTLFAGVFVCGGLLWHKLAPHRRRPGSLPLGATAGVLTAIVSYPVVTLLGETGRIVGVGPGGLPEHLLYAVEVAALLIVTTGLLPVVVMGMVGALLSRLLRTKEAPSAPGDGPLARRWSIAGATIVLVLAAAFAVLSSAPPDPGGLDRLPAAAPAAGHDEALARFAKVAAQEASLPLDRRCLSRLLTHGSKTAVAVVYLHGLTTCPAQADVLAQRLYDQGYNVYLPRFPGHGETDRHTDALVSLSAEDVVRTADLAVDIAHGLGDEVAVVGLSGGGTVAMWQAQHRSGLTRPIAVAPFLVSYSVPLWASRAAMNLLMALPNIMVQWDEELVESRPEMDYAYQQVPTWALAQFMRLGELLDERAARFAPLAMTPGLLLNEADATVNNALAKRVAAAWTARGASVDIGWISAERGMPHDVIDPRQPGAQIDYVYPRVFGMIAGAGK